MWGCVGLVLCCSDGFEVRLAYCGDYSCHPALPLPCLLWEQTMRWHGSALFRTAVCLGKCHTALDVTLLKPEGPGGGGGQG